MSLTSFNRNYTLEFKTKPLFHRDFTKVIAKSNIKKMLDGSIYFLIRNMTYSIGAGEPWKSFNRFPCSSQSFSKEDTSQATTTIQSISFSNNSTA
jgi:hypothetical protein